MLDLVDVAARGGHAWAALIGACTFRPRQAASRSIAGASSATGCGAAPSRMRTNAWLLVTMWLTRSRTLHSGHGVGAAHCSSRTAVITCSVASRAVESWSTGSEVIGLLP